jgi:hypothetical protein
MTLGPGNRLKSPMQNMRITDDEKVHVFAVLERTEQGGSGLASPSPCRWEIWLQDLVDTRVLLAQLQQMYLCVSERKSRLCAGTPTNSSGALRTARWRWGGGAISLCRASRSSSAWAEGKESRLRPPSPAGAGWPLSHGACALVSRDLTAEVIPGALCDPRR